MHQAHTHTCPHTPLTGSYELFAAGTLHMHQVHGTGAAYQQPSAQAPNAQYATAPGVSEFIFVCS
jgi:hypothetical protein